MSRGREDVALQQLAALSHLHSRSGHAAHYCCFSLSRCHSRCANNSHHGHYVGPSAFVHTHTSTHRQILLINTYGFQFDGKCGCFIYITCKKCREFNSAGMIFFNQPIMVTK